MQTVHSGGLQMGRCTVMITFSRFTSVIRDFGWRTCRVDGTLHYAVLNQLGRNDRAHDDQDECASQAACSDYTGCMPPRVSLHAAST